MAGTRRGVHALEGGLGVCAHIGTDEAKGIRAVRVEVGLVMRFVAVAVFGHHAFV